LDSLDEIFCGATKIGEKEKIDIRDKKWLEIAGPGHVY